MGALITSTFKAIGSLFIPGMLRHNEIRTSETMEILEVSSPSHLGTKPCDPPAGWATKKNG